MPPTNLPVAPSQFGDILKLHKSPPSSPLPYRHGCFSASGFFPVLFTTASLLTLGLGRATRIHTHTHTLYMRIYFLSLISSQYLCVNRFVGGDEEGVVMAESIFCSSTKHLRRARSDWNDSACVPRQTAGLRITEWRGAHPPLSWTPVTQQDCFMFLINNKLPEITQAPATVRANYRLDFTGRKDDEVNRDEMKFCSAPPTKAGLRMIKTNSVQFFVPDRMFGRQTVQKKHLHRGEDVHTHSRHKKHHIFNV